MALAPESPLQEFEGQVFRDVFDVDSGRTFSDYELRDCLFENCTISSVVNPNRRSTIRRVAIFGGKASGVSIHPAILEDIWVEDLETMDPVRIRGAVFKRVTLTGRVGSIEIGPKVPKIDPSRQVGFDQANAMYYRYAPWALDISEAQAVSLRIHGVPSALVRRDPETQAVLTAVGAIRGDWHRVAMPEEWIAAFDETAAARGPETILACPKASSEFGRYFSALEELRSRGVVARN